MFHIQGDHLSEEKDWVPEDPSQGLACPLDFQPACLQGCIDIPFAGAYTASKFAVEGLSESYHYELAPLGVDVAIVEPGGFPTGYWSKMMNPADQARVSGYAPEASLPDHLWHGVMANLQSEQAPDP